jgi:hypothetical protein
MTLALMDAVGGGVVGIRASGTWIAPTRGWINSTM